MKLLNLIPMFYRKIEEIVEIFRVVEHEIIDLKSNVNSKVEEMNISTAVSDLDRWEKQFGIPTNKNLSVNDRRERIISKLRGSGTTTKRLVQNVSEAYSNGEVEVIEESNRYLIKIKFVGTRGIPSNLDGLKRALREIIPAHLEIEYIFTYLTWSEFVGYNKTVAQWNVLRLTADGIRTYRG